jgi:hypothetical protein
MPRRSRCGGAIAAIGWLVLCILILARPAVAQNASVREGASCASP